MWIAWAITATALCLAALAMLFLSKKRYQQKEQEAQEAQQQSANALSEADDRQQRLESQLKALRAELTMTEELLQKEVAKARASVRELESLQNRVERDYVERLGTGKALSGISHELRTPLNAVMGFAQLLRDRTTDDTDAHFVDIICHNSQKLIDLVDNTIDLFKLNVGSLIIRPPAPCDIDTLMFDVYTYFNELRFKQDKENVNIRLLNTSDDDEPCILHTDAHRLRQVLFCLMDNAIKFTDKGEVDFGYTVHPDDHLVQIFVRDTGVGIPDDQHAHIYDPFVQLDHGPKRKYSGLGIGLYICKQVVDRLGGNIWFESTYGSGTTFFVMLPMEKSTSPSRRQSDDSRPKEYDWSGRRILVVDDIRSNFKLIEQALRDTKSAVIWASNGQEALQMLRQEQFDFVLMDVQMPVMDGIEATRLARAEGMTIPIIAQTAQDAVRDNARRYIDAGCNGVIEKPFNINRLKALIDLHINIEQ